MKQYIAKNNIKFYTIDATDLGVKIGLGNRINMIMQSAFFALTKVIPVEDAEKYLKKSIEKTYGRKGENVVKMNWAAVDAGLTGFHAVKVPAAWKDAVDAPAKAKKVPEFIENVLVPMNRQEGDKLPVSTFVDIADGTFPSGTAAYEKRGVAVKVPMWHPENCIQCNQCSFVCPHATIRPILLTEEEKAKAPASFTTIPAMGKEATGMAYRMQVSPLDCLGCGNCADICPGKKGAKALTMEALFSMRSAISGTVIANSQFSSSLRWVSRGFMTRAFWVGSSFFLPRQTSTQLPQPVQSSGDTWTRSFMPVNSLPMPGLVT